MVLPKESDMRKKPEISTSFEGPPPFLPDTAQPEARRMAKPVRRKLHVTGNGEPAVVGILAAGVPDTD